MGFHRKFGPGANPTSRWFSLLAKAASLTCFEDWHDLATQDGTFGDSQRHDPIPGNEPIQRIIHRWGIVGNSRHGIASDAVTTDEFEVWFDKGVTDGLPVVPPTRERVERMLSGTRRSPGELLGEMPPNYGRLTIEKAAINAVLAGCRPEYLPVVIAASECAMGSRHRRISRRRSSSSTDRFGGASASTAGSESSAPATARTRRSAARCGS